LVKDREQLADHDGQLHLNNAHFILFESSRGTEGRSSLGETDRCGRTDYVGLKKKSGGVMRASKKRGVMSSQAFLLVGR
jgi:hypothetical protein